MALVTSDPSPHASPADSEHRGWTLQTTWFRSSLGVSEGWVCFATRPFASHRVNIGRWGNSEQALEHGRAYVDRRMDNQGVVGGNLPIQKRRP
jgi:hypothetical protein